MPTERIAIPEDLLRLQPSAALESISMSKLARTGTAVLQQILSTAQAVAVKIQGQGAMVTLSQRQYDEMIDLIQKLQQEQEDDGFTRGLSRRFDELTAQMNRPGGNRAVDTALFGDVDSLNQNYGPGSTEKKLCLSSNFRQFSGSPLPLRPSAWTTRMESRNFLWPPWVQAEQTWERRPPVGLPPSGGLTELQTAAMPTAGS